MPKTKLVYMHINDNSNACENGTFDKNKSSFVSLSLQEACKLRLMMSTMDPKVADLLNAVRPQGKKRKLEATHDGITASDADTLLADFNALQGNGTLTNGNQQLFSVQPTAANVQYAPLPYETAPAFNNFQQAANVQYAPPPPYGAQPTFNSYQQPIATISQQPAKANEQCFALPQYQQSSATYSDNIPVQQAAAGCQQPAASSYQAPQQFKHYEAGTNTAQYHNQVWGQNGNQQNN